jgi:hypothetical protein
MRRLASITSLLILSVSLSGCGLMEDAFKAGVIFALIIIAIIALVIWLAHMAGRTVMKRYDLTWDEDEIIRENKA